MQSVCFFCSRLFSPRPWTRAAPPENTVLLLARVSPTEGSFALLLLDGENERARPVTCRKVLSARYIFRPLHDFSDDVDKLLAEAINTAVLMRKTLHYVQYAKQYLNKTYARMWN